MYAGERSRYARMEGRQHADHARAGVIVEPAPARAHDAFASAEQGLGRGIAERHQHVRIDQLDLALDEGQADLRFLRRWCAVAGWAPGNHIGDIGFGAIEPDRADHAVQQLAGTSDEGQALDVLVAPRCFADEHDAGFRIAVGKHQPRRGCFQRAAVEALHQLAQIGERRCCPRRLAGRSDRRVWRRRSFAWRKWERNRRRSRGLRRDRVHPPRGDFRLGQAIDRLLGQRAVDTRLQIEGQELLDGKGGFWRHPARAWRR